MEQRATIMRGSLRDCPYYSFSGAVHQVPRSADCIAGNSNGKGKVIGNSNEDRPKLFIAKILFRTQTHRLEHSMTITDSHLVSIMLFFCFFINN